jgi:hypothetical protein
MAVPKHLGNPQYVDLLQTMRALIDEGRDLLPVALQEGVVGISRHNQIQDLIDSLERAWERRDLDRGREVTLRITKCLAVIRQEQARRQPIP